MTLLNTKGPTPPIDFDGYNTSGSIIPAFSAVRITGAAAHPDDTGVFPTIGLATADDTGLMPCAGITTADIESGATGTVRSFGPLFNLDTSAFTGGDVLYVDGAVAGGLVASNNPPADIQQRAAVVLTADATEGVIFVLLDTMMDGHVSYTNRSPFSLMATGLATAELAFQATGGSTQVQTTPTGARVITLPDDTGTLELVGGHTVTLTGDVTGSGTGSFAATIANDAVTFAKTQNIASGSVLGRFSGGSGDVQEIAVGVNQVVANDAIGGLGAYAVATGMIANDAVTMVKLANIASQTVIGRGDASSGDPSACTLETGIQVTTGEVFKAAGRVLRRTVYTSGSGTHTPGTDCNLMRVTCLGGGGGGGGAGWSSGQTGVGAGGAAGAICEKVAANSGTYAYAVGAAGTGGAAGANNGTDGGDTTFTGTNFALTATRGQFGVGGASTATSSTNLGGSGLAATGGDWNGAGQSGFPGIVINGSVAGSACSGQGGSASPFGRGGISRTAHGAGVVGLGPGAGGGGGHGNTATRAGGDGTAGIIIVEELS